MVASVLPIATPTATDLIVPAIPASLLPIAGPRTPRSSFGDIAIDRGMSSSCHPSGSTKMVGASRHAHARDQAVAENIRFVGTATRHYAKSAGLLFCVARFTNWCGHGQKLIPVPDDGEFARLVAVIGTAK